MITKSKPESKDLNGSKIKVFNDGDLLSESLMKKLVQREMARIVRTSEVLCIAAVCFEKLLINAATQNESDNKVKLFFKSVEKLKKHVRETDLIGWIKRDSTFGIVFTVENAGSKEKVESRINEILEIPSFNANSVNIDIDVTMWSAEHDGKNGGNLEIAAQNYFQKKKQFMNLE